MAGILTLIQTGMNHRGRICSFREARTVDIAKKANLVNLGRTVARGWKIKSHQSFPVDFPKHIQLSGDFWDV